MIAYVMAHRTIDAHRAVDELRSLDHVGLAYVYRDAVAAMRPASPVDYDPCAIGRR